MSTPPGARRPGGRTQRVREQVHRAVVDLLGDGVGEGLTLPAVAARAGVHPATLYRRWGTVAALLQDVADAGPARVAELPDTGTLRGDLLAYSTGVAQTLGGPVGVPLLRAVLGSGGAGPGRAAALLAERALQLQELLDRAASRGEAAPTVEALLDVVVAPLYFDALFGRAVDPGRPAALVERLLSGGGS